MAGYFTVQYLYATSLALKNNIKMIDLLNLKAPLLAFTQGI